MGFPSSCARGTPNARALPTDVVTWALENIDHEPTRKVFIDCQNPDNSLSAADVRDLVCKLIAGLRATGIQSGDNVCVISHNSIYYTSVLLGIIGCGARFVAGNPAYSDGELAHLLKTANVKLVIAEPNVLQRLSHVARSCGICDTRIFSFDPLANTEVWNRSEVVSYRSWCSLLQAGRSSWLRLDAHEVKHTTAALLMTSGTTGMPKAAMLSHFALVKQAEIVDESAVKGYETRRLICIPQFHAFTIPIAHLTPLRYGQTVWIMPRFQTQDFVKSISRFRISEIAIVPPIVHKVLLEVPTSEALDRLTSIRHVQCAGAPLSPDKQRQFTQLLRCDAVFSQVWGMTEIGWITAVPYHGENLVGSVGKLLQGFEARIAGNPEANHNQLEGDSPDKLIPGEILVRSSTMMQGYLSNKAATDKIIRNGWLRTGDIGSCRNGNWYITDREKDIIKVRAWQVSPSEIEACLQEHLLVQDAAVVGITLNESEGEVPRAYIVLDTTLAHLPYLESPLGQSSVHTRAGSALEQAKAPLSPVLNSTTRSAISRSADRHSASGEVLGLDQSVYLQTTEAQGEKTCDRVSWREASELENEMAGFVANRLAKFKHLAGGVRFVPAIPRNTSGKVLRKELQEQAKHELSL